MACRVRGRLVAVNRTWCTTFLAVAALGAALHGEVTIPKYFDLEIGDPARKAKHVSVAVDTLVDTTTGDTITPEELAGRLAKTQLLLIGESHTSMEFHKVQYRTIRALKDAGRRVLVGLEMFPAPEQRSLDQWRDGLLTEQGFVRLSRWYEHWGYHWNFYRDIFLYARDEGIPMYALNTPRDVVQAVRKKGIANLTPEEAKYVPPQIRTDDPEHFTFFKATMEGGDMSHGGSDDMLKAFAAAQATWDATMGYNAVKALEAVNDPMAIMVVLVGSGHVAYGVGIELQAKAWFKGGISTLVPVPVVLADGRAVPKVRASYADYVWGLPEEFETLFPRLGISTRTGSTDAQREVIMVERDSVAAKAGFQAKDVLVSMDGQPIQDREVFNRLMARKQWGDGATFVVKRGDQEVTLKAFFRRLPLKITGTAAP
jgi:uncharacterized iron-regulated protein